MNEKIREKKKILELADQVKKKYTGFKKSLNERNKLLKDAFTPIIKPLEELKNVIPTALESKSKKIIENKTKACKRKKLNPGLNINEDDVTQFFTPDNVGDSEFTFSTAKKPKKKKNEAIEQIVSESEKDDDSNGDDDSINIEDDDDEESEKGEDYSDEETSKTSKDITLKKFNLPPLNDQQYGINYNHHDKKLYIGNFPVAFTHNTIEIKNQKFPRTDGVVNLLTQNKILKKNVSATDIKTYYDILKLTKTHLRKIIP